MLTAQQGRADRLATGQIRAHIAGMIKNHPPLHPQLTPREYKDGRGWYIEAIVDGGAAENIGDFGSASEAQDWIIQKSTAYFRARQK
jgi:hypothetical protein